MPSDLDRTVLFLDDEPDLIDTFVNNFEDVFRVLTATDGARALDLLRDEDVAVMVTDQRMPGLHGLEVIRRALEVRPDVVPIILTGFTNDSDLIEAINLQRVYRYIAKPWDPDELLHTVEGALEKHRLIRDNRRLQASLEEANARLRAENALLKAGDIPPIIVGDAPPVRQMLEDVRRVASKHVTVLVEGETGTGKELIARAIHAASPRHQRVFVAVNCAELSQDAAESRLFGHRKGSFTGAIDDHKGFFEVADGGTLFLDEIGELTPALQAKLLRVLQEGEVVRFGETKPRKVDVRVVAATNRVLDDEVKAGRFRADLLYRLNVFPITAPPLRARPGDIEKLAEHFLTLHARRMRMPTPRLADAARRALRAHPFPGNVRDLENMMVRALILLDDGDEVTPAELPALDPSLEEEQRLPAAPGESTTSVNEGLLATVAAFERQEIERAIAAADGNRTKAARSLRISYRWLLKKLERYGMASAPDDVG